MDNPFEFHEEDGIIACVGDNGGTTDDDIRNGFKRTVEILIKSLKVSQEVEDLLVYPIVYNARHSIELSLKIVIKMLWELERKKKITLILENIHNTQMCLPLKPVLSRDRRGLPNFMDETFTGLINKYGIAASNLHLEITETTLMTDFEKNMNIIHKLQGVGFRVEIDDFGSGYSSLNMLKDISADVLKIDMGFLRKSENEVKGQDILESIITLAGKIGMDVITEGVETKKQLDMLTMMGCHEFQGYYFSKPVPVSEFEEKYLV